MGVRRRGEDVVVVWYHVHGALLADDGRGGGRGEEAVLGHVDAHHTVGHGDLGDDLQERREARDE